MLTSIFIPNGRNKFVGFIIVLKHIVGHAADPSGTEPLELMEQVDGLPELVLPVLLQKPVLLDHLGRLLPL